MKNNLKPGDLVVVNNEAGTMIGWKGVIIGSVDGFLRVYLKRNVVGDKVLSTVDFLPSMLDLREALEEETKENLQGA